MERVDSASCASCSAAQCEVCGLTKVIGGGRSKTQIIACSSAIQAVLRRAAQFARAQAPVAILGESGTGKEVVARALHASSARAEAPFVAVNVAALPAELLESELFGHVRGAFTGAIAAKRGLFQAADGGTLFLDEIAEMPLPLQAKLLRALQDGEVRRVGDTQAIGVDARIVCATHRNLADQVARGAFREDLLYRLKVLTLRVPPLRERVEDIRPLASMFVEQENADLRFTSAAYRVLEGYAWPGNVRELSNAVKHGVALARNGVIEVDDLPEELRAPAGGRPTTASRSPSPGDVLQPLAEIEREHVLRVLEACGGSQTDAARVLGIGRNTLWRKLRQYA
jgi:two-component system response regulator HydG